MLAVVYSTRDPAGSGIARFIVDRLGLSGRCSCPRCVSCFENGEVIVVGFNEDVINFDFLDDVLPSEVDLYIVASRHSSEAGVKSYTVHFTGNFGSEALFGGRPMELGMAHPPVAWFLLNRLNREAEQFGRKGEYEVSYEATHHGPTSLSKPLVFVEIGSSHNEWNDSVNHAIVGTAVYELVLSYKKLPECVSVIGVGGGHYPRKHTELALTTNKCYGHILPKYALQYLSEEILEMMFKRTVLPPQEVLIEKKGTRTEHRNLIEEYAKMKHARVTYI